VLSRLEAHQAANLYQSRVSNVLFEPKVYVAETTFPAGTSSGAAVTTVRPDPYAQAASDVSNSLQMIANDQLLRLAAFIYREGMPARAEVPAGTVLDKNVYFLLPPSMSAKDAASQTFLLRLGATGVEIAFKVVAK
jgi:hypothetical protein